MKRIPIAAVLVLVSSVLAFDLGVCAEETAALASSGPWLCRRPKKDAIPAVDSGPSAGQTQNDWDSYFAYIGRLKIDLQLDGFAVRPVWVQANGSFKVVVQFQIGEDQHPKEIQLVEGERYIDAEAAKACVAKWTLSGLLPNKEYSVFLTWEHIKGYTMLALTGDQLSLAVKLRTLI